MVGSSGGGGIMRLAILVSSGTVAVISGTVAISSGTGRLFHGKLFCLKSTREDKKTHNPYMYDNAAGVTIYGVTQLFGLRTKQSQLVSIRHTMGTPVLCIYAQ